MSVLYKMYTDGSCKGNPGPGGYAAIILDPALPGQETIVRGNSRGVDVTNNQMELLAVIRGLEYLPPGSDVEVYSDSKYVVDCFLKKWYTKWRENGWRTSSGSSVLNQELWKTLLTLVENHVTISWSWVKAHSGIPYNERADRIATLEATRQ
jgi:ribonuclease HI